MQFFSPSHGSLLFFAITQAEIAQRPKCVRGYIEECDRVGGVMDTESLKEDLEKCKHFPVESEMDNEYIYSSILP